MADVSHHRNDLTGHPDVSEMRDRYDRMMGSRDVVLLDGPVLLAGLYVTISPWVVHFSGNTDLTVNNLILGICVALMGIGLTVAPRRMYSLCHAMAAIGVWLIISPWVVTRAPDLGMILNNAILGACILLFGLIAGGMLVFRMTRERAAARAS